MNLVAGSRRKEQLLECLLIPRLCKAWRAGHGWHWNAVGSICSFRWKHLLRNSPSWCLHITLGTSNQDLCMDSVVELSWDLQVREQWFLDSAVVSHHWNTIVLHQTQTQREVLVPLSRLFGRTWLCISWISPDSCSCEASTEAIPQCCTECLTMILFSLQDTRCLSVLTPWLWPRNVMCWVDTTWRSCP